MKGKILLTQDSTAEINHEVNETEIMSFLEELEKVTQWRIAEMIGNIKSRIAETYSVSKENNSVYMYGGKNEILIKIETKQKGAEIVIPR
jgi:hypothetical protein